MHRFQAHLVNYSTSLSPKSSHTWSWSVNTSTSQGGLDLCVVENELDDEGAVGEV
jgi:hypothetical protein